MGGKEKNESADQGLYTFWTGLGQASANALHNHGISTPEIPHAPPTSAFELLPQSPLDQWTLRSTPNAARWPISSFIIDPSSFSFSLLFSFVREVRHAPRTPLVAAEFVN